MHHKYHLTMDLKPANEFRYAYRNLERKIVSGYSRTVLHLLVRFGDLSIAVDHLNQQPEGEEHQQNIHHDL